MIDPDLKVQLDSINENLVAIKKKNGGGVWRSFFNGMFGALGYVAGLAIIVVILGWILQKSGLLPAFETQVNNFTDLVSAAKNLIPESQKSTPPPPSNQTTNTSQPQTPTIVTLPNGQKIQVNLPSGY